MTPLTDAQLDRYQRQIILRDFGGAAQVRLAGAHILVIGAGGIGCPAMQYLAAAGVGAITVIDDDLVCLSNLHRQILFTEQMIGLPKVEAAENMIRQYRPDINFHTIKHRLTAEFVQSQSAAFFAAFAAIIDGSDNFATRLLVNDIALAHHIPLVSAAIGQFQGQLATFRGWHPDQPCYRCFVGDAFDAEDCDNCSEVGVLGPMVGVMGSYAAMEAVRVVTGFGEDQAGRLQLIDGLKLTMRAIRLTKDAACKSCAAIADGG
jgi:adenylyltransferase/sulfurtransferase